MGATQKWCPLCVCAGQVQARVAMNSVVSSSVSDQTEMDLECIGYTDCTGILWVPDALMPSTISKLRMPFLNKRP